MMSLKYICIKSVIFFGKQDKIFRKQEKYLVYDTDKIVHFFLHIKSYLKIVSSLKNRFFQKSSFILICF